MRWKRNDNRVTVSSARIRPQVTHTVNQDSHRGLRHPMASGLLTIMVLFGLGLPFQAHAQFTGNATATTQFESNSNVFDLDSGIGQQPSTSFRRSDTDLAYGAAFNGSYTLGQQQFYAMANTLEYQYQHFTELNHNDYNLNGGLNWRLADLFDGKFDVIRSHTMVPFLDLSGTLLALAIATEQRESALVGIKVTRDWRIEASGYTSKTEEPLPEAPNLQLTEVSASTAVKYQGVTGLTSGLTYTYLWGAYNGSSGSLNPSYTQATAGFLVNYKLNRSTFEGQVGYSRRDSTTGSDNTSGLTGLIDFKEQLTPKTSFTAKIDRAINNYIFSSGSEIDTEAGVGVDWQATYKTGLSLGYTFTYRAYPPQAINPTDAFRVDYQHFVTLAINYKPTRWLQVRAYGNLQTRNSNFYGNDFNSKIFGITLTAAVPDQPK